MRISLYLVTGTATAAAAVVGGLASGPAVRSAWYRRLRKPAYQPPAQVFPVVWPALYADIAVVSAVTLDRLHDERDMRRARSYRAALALNLVLNAGWSWVFFRRRQLGAAAALAAILTASSADLARRSVAVRGAAGAPLALYPLWCAFATVLSTHIRLLNPRI